MYGVIFTSERFGRVNYSLIDGVCRLEIASIRRRDINGRQDPVNKSASCVYKCYRDIFEMEVLESLVLQRLANCHCVDCELRPVLYKRVFRLLAGLSLALSPSSP